MERKTQCSFPRSEVGLSFHLRGTRKALGIVPNLRLNDELATECGRERTIRDESYLFPVKDKTQLALLTLGDLYAKRARLLSDLARDLGDCTNDQTLVPGLRLRSLELEKLAEGILSIEPSVTRLFLAN